MRDFTFLHITERGMLLSKDDHIREIIAVVERGCPVRRGGGVIDQNYIQSYA